MTLTFLWRHRPHLPQNTFSLIIRQQNKLSWWKCTSGLIWGRQRQWWRLFLNLSTSWRHTDHTLSPVMHQKSNSLIVWRHHALKFKSHHCVCHPQISLNIHFHRNVLFPSNAIELFNFWGITGVGCGHYNFMTCSTLKIDVNIVFAVLKLVQMYIFITITCFVTELLAKMYFGVNGVCDVIERSESWMKHII